MIHAMAIAPEKQEPGPVTRGLTLAADVIQEVTWGAASGNLNHNPIPGFPQRLRYTTRLWRNRFGLILHTAALLYVSQYLTQGEIHPFYYIPFGLHTLAIADIGFHHMRTSRGRRRFMRPYKNIVL